MPTAHDVLVSALGTGKAVLHRFADDLTPAELLHRVVPAGNCAAWIIGHLIMTERSGLTRLGVPADKQPALPEGFEARFARDETAPKLAEYGDVAGLLPLFDVHRDLLIEAVRGLPAERLDEALPKPHPMFGNVYQLVTFLGVTHLSMHAGQITVIRRSLGRAPIV
ncbi:MAG TPA: DinB family protein [Tepidisphaeraceae bacterium]|nr:DinB family protein [Tepidisphaeraceae bacterium]